jgi:hypothetical protein
MAIIFNPETNSYQWDYENDGPYTGDPFDPATGQPIAADMLPPGVNPDDQWGPQASGGDYWNVLQGDAEPEAAPAPAGAPSPTPSPAPSGASGGGNLSSLLSPYLGRFQMPDMDAAGKGAVGRLPQLPGFKAPDLPTFDPFESPTFDQMLASDPGYGGRVKMGEQAIMNKKSAQGLARMPATLKGLLDYNSQIASNEFGNFYGRKQGEYQMNVGNKLNLWDRDLAGRKAEYEPNILKYTTEAGVGERAGNNAWDRAFKLFQTDYDLWRDQRDSSFDKLAWSSDQGQRASS